MLINTDENVTLKIKNEVNTNNSNQKLLGILFNNNEHVTSLCWKASQMLSTLARVAHYMNLITNAFIFSKFAYYLLVRMFHRTKQSNRINNMYERVLRIVFREYKSTFKQLLKQIKSVPIHQKNLQILATENF